MAVQRKNHSKGEIRVENIGGIRETTIEFTPGVTILVGRNATNRTSFLQAVMAALGSENVAIKGDTDEATVELELGEETYTRRLSRRSGGVVSEGEPLLDDPTLADLFAFLLGSNEARRAVSTSQDLRDLIMRPIDVDEIQADIDRLLDERESLEGKLDRIDDLKGDLPELETKRARLADEIEAKRAELEAKEEELEAADGTVDETREEQSELEDKLEELRSQRSRIDDVRYDLETEQESLEALEAERRELETELEELPATPVGDVDELDAELDELRQRKQRLEADVNELQSIIGFNEEMIEDSGSSVIEGTTETEFESVTDQLLDDEVRCWTCGGTVEQDQIESTVERLRELSQTKVTTVRELENEIRELQSEKRELERTQRERDRIERRLSELEGEIERTEETIEQFIERRDELTAEIEAVESEVDELESKDYSEVLGLHKEANQLEYELGSLESDLERVDSQISDIEDRIAEQGEVETRLDEVNTETEALRTKIERIEQGAVEQFNKHMDTVLEILDYANLDRIWLERVEREVREGRRKVSKSAFELHIVRTSESGTAYEDTIDHLSESEREVTGFVFALAGYLAHEVYEEVPFILLDSLEAIDSERIATLVEYLTDYTGYLLVALLPEDAAALPAKYERIAEI